MANNKILIAIPSKNRVEILKKNALSWVPLTGFDWVVFVEPQDSDKYASLLEGGHGYVLPENNKGLGYAKTFIKKYAEENGYTHIFKIDDDVQGFTKYRQKLYLDVTANWFKDFMKDIEVAFYKYPKVKAVSFPYNFEMYELKKWEVTKRVQTAFICRTQDFFASEKISVFEDFALGLKIIVNGGLILKYCMAGIEMGVKVGGGSGGHQSFDRFEQAKAEAVELRKIYPPLNFRKVDKSWKIEPDLSSLELNRS